MQMNQRQLKIQDRETINRPNPQGCFHQGQLREIEHILPFPASRADRLKCAQWGTSQWTPRISLSAFFTFLWPVFSILNLVC
jgi:hypothetical protein